MICFFFLFFLVNASQIRYCNTLRALSAPVVMNQGDDVDIYSKPMRLLESEFQNSWSGFS